MRFDPREPNARLWHFIRHDHVAQPEGRAPHGKKWSREVSATKLETHRQARLRAARIKELLEQGVDPLDIMNGKI